MVRDDRSTVEGTFRADRVLFDGAAAAYDRSRPGYPDDLINELAGEADITNASRILEIGCGTGQLTRLLAPTGASIDCVELGANLAQVARENLRGFENVAVHRAPFEDWKAPNAPYDLITSAQAFHWIPPEIGYPKCRELLKPSGTLALIWNLCAATDDDIRVDLNEVYRHLAPELHQSHPEPPKVRIERTLGEIRASGCFGEPSIREYPWTDTYDAERYADLLRSFSDHRRLGEERLERLIDEVARLIGSRGGVISRHLVAVLFLCPR